MMEPEMWRPQVSFDHRVTDNAQLESLNATGAIAVHFSTNGRSVDLAFAGSQSETLSVWETVSSSGFTTTPKMSARLVTLRFVDRGALIRVDRGGTDKIVGAGQALLTSFEIMCREQAAPRFSSISATVSCEGIVAACTAMFGDGTTIAPIFETTVSTRTREMRAVQATALTLRRALTTKNTREDFLAPLLEEVFLYQLLGCWPLNGDARVAQSGIAGSDLALARAVDFIEGNLSRQIAVCEVAAAAGIGVRTLQALFRDRLGRGPIQYLLERRLDRVSEELCLGSGEPIQVIARRWGFVHMSDFARRYRERHGRLPSQDAC